jgi:hypothetical protein
MARMKVAMYGTATDCRLAGTRGTQIDLKVKSASNSEENEIL